MSKKAMLAGAAAAAVLAAAASGAGAEKAAEPSVMQAHVFLPITKVDAKNRTIEARITDETVDAVGEICDYESSAPLFKVWSDNAATKTAGKSKGNVRAMHQPIAAGKLIDITFDDDAKAIECVVKIVDDAEWEKFDEGLYTGLSLGGNYVGKKWKDADSGAWRYTVDPIEVSLVDVPCNPSATFKYAAADGSEVTKSFKPWEPTNAEIATKAAALAEGAGDKTAWADHMDAAKEALVKERAGFTWDDVRNAPVEILDEDEEEEAPAAAAEEEVAAAEGETAADEVEAEKTKVVDWGVDQVFQVKADGSVHASKKVALEHVTKLQAVQAVGGDDLLSQAIAKAKAAVAGEPEAAATEDGEPPEKVSLKGLAVTPGLADALEALKLVRAEAADGETVEKSLWGAGRFIEYVSGLISLQNDAAWEAEYERDDSAVPSQMAEAIRNLGSIALAMVQEELAEDLGRLREVKTAAATPEVVKTVLAAVEGDEALCQKVAKRAPAGEAIDVQKVIAERDEYKAQVEKAIGSFGEVTESVTKMRGELDAAKAEIVKLKADPAPMPTIVKGASVVGREGGEPAMTPERADQIVKSIVDEYGPEGLARLAMKAAQQKPILLTATTPATGG
jgi:hypothetical protein